MKNKSSIDEVTTPLLLNCHPQYAQWIEPVALGLQILLGFNLSCWVVPSPVTGIEATGFQTAILIA